MSRGSFQIVGEHSEAAASLYDCTPYTLETFASVPWIKEKDSILIDGLEFPKEAIPALNALIGKLLFEVQMGSFVDDSSQSRLLQTSRAREEAGFFPQEDPTVRYDYYSTLSPTNLVIILRNELPNLVRELVQLLDEDASSALREAIDSVPVSEGRDSIRTKALSVTEGVDHGRELQLYKLLTDEGKALLEKFGPGVVEMVETLLQNIGASILARAELSYPSTVNDLECVAGDKSALVGDLVGQYKVEPVVKYSTLNPKDLIEMMHRSLEMITFGLIQELPEDQRREIMDRAVAAV